MKTGAALIGVGRRSESRVAGVNGRAAGQERVGEGRAPLS